MKKTVKKGYTITCVSWENDGDYYDTKSVTVETKEMADSLKDLCKLCETPAKKGYNTIGNADMEGLTDFQKEMVINFMKSNPILIKKENASDNSLINMFNEYNHSLLGNSEHYYSRVCESVKITYSPE
jgi:hypothetical protein